MAASYYSTMLGFRKLFRMAHSFTNVYKGRPHGQMLDFIHCGNRTENMKEFKD